MRSKLLLLAPLFLAITKVGAASACIIRFRPAEELKAEATLVVVATILSRQVGTPSITGELYSYGIKPHSVTHGNSAEAVNKVTYFNKRAHKRGDLVVCPLKNGSGLELSFKEGTTYRLYLKSASETEILFSELAE